MTTVATTLPEPQEILADCEKLPYSQVGLLRRVAVCFTQPDIRNGVLSLFDQAIVSGTGFVTSVIIGRVCSIEQLGIFYLALSIVYLARDLQEQLICSPYQIYCQGRRDDARARYSGSALLHKLVLTGISLVALAGVLGLNFFGIGATGLSPAVWALLGVLPFLQLREFIRRTTIAHLQLTTATVIDVGVAIFQIGGLAVLTYVGRLTIASAYGVMGAACAVACLGWFLTNRYPMRFSRSDAIQDWRHNWRFARWAVVCHLLGFASPYLMPLILTLTCGSNGAGVWAASISVVGLASMFMMGIATYLLPRAANAFYNGGINELQRILRRAVLVYCTVLGAFVLFVFATGDLLLVLAYGTKYANHGAVIGVLALSVFVSSLGVTFGTGLWVINRPEGNLPADVCSLVVTLAITYCLIPTLGVLGAAIGDLGGKLVGSLTRYFTLRQLLQNASIPVATQ